MEDSLPGKVIQLQAELDSLHKAITVLNQLAAELDIHTAMQNVRQVALELLDCERVTLFLIFERRKELRAMIDQNEILRIQFGEGIAGLVAQNGGSMNLPDVYQHPMFNKEVDRATGFRTRSMLCMAVSDMTGKNVAVLQALNKKSGQPFTCTDERNLKLFGTHLGNTLVKAKLHETAKREKERLQAIYNCFKGLNTAEEVGQMVVCATTALERDIIHADRVFFFLVDKPRGELWLHTHQAEPLRLRMGQPGGVVGRCAESKKPQSWAEFEDPSQDPALRKLAPQLAPARIKSVLVQPIHGTNNDRVLAVVLAINKREAEGTNDIFFEPFFTDADCDAMALFAYEVGDLLSERSLELSLLSALSVVGHDGAHPNANRPSADGTSTAGVGPGSPTSSSAVSGAEDLIRSQLIQMYLPEYKKEVANSHSVFNRNSFSSANATATHVRASMERKRNAMGIESLYRRGVVRNRDCMSAGGRLAPATKSCLGVTSHVQPSRLAINGDEDLSVTPATGGGYSDSPTSPAPTSDASEMQALPELRSLRCSSSTQAEHPAIALRYSASRGMSAGGGPVRSGGSLTLSRPVPAAVHSVSHEGIVGGLASLARPAVFPSGLLPLPPMPTHGAQHGRMPHEKPTSPKADDGNVKERVPGFGRFRAPWRRASVNSGATPGAASPKGESDSGGSSGEAEDKQAETFELEYLGGEDGELSDGSGAVRTSSGDASDRKHKVAAQGTWRRRGQSTPPDVFITCQEGERPFGVLPEPFAELTCVQEELRATESMLSAVADPEALRTHLSCNNLAEAGSPRSPCFYSQEQLQSWEWDFTQFTVEELIKLAYDIFTVSGVMEEFALQPKVMRNFLAAVASHYHVIPYHNFNHVCHVLHSTFLVATTTRVASVLPPLDRLSLLLAALCHDLDHDGHSNSFHVNSGSELSRIYNDQSVMENHHCAMTFAILSRIDCNVLFPLSPEEQRAARKTIISAILCTDMANHFNLTQEFQKHNVLYEPDNESDRLLLIKVLLHAADIGNAVRPFHVNHAMSRRVHREFEAQANEEERLGLPVTFAVDTSDHVMCARVELNFLDYVVTTLWERLVDVLPELAPQMAQLRVNRARYRRIADTGLTADQVIVEEAQQQQKRDAPEAEKDNVSQQGTQAT